MNNRYVPYNSNPQVTAPKTDLRIVSAILAGALTLWSIIQGYEFCSGVEYYSDVAKTLGTIAVLLNICMWGITAYLVGCNKDNRTLRNLFIVSSGVSFLFFIADMEIIDWYWDFRVVLILGQSFIVTVSMIILLSMQNRISACKAWFVPGLICSVIYLMDIEAILMYGFDSFRLFLKYMLFPGCTVAYFFILMLWLSNREKESWSSAHNPAVDYRPYGQVPVPQPVPVPTTVSAVQPDPELDYVELIGSAFTEGGCGERVTDLRFRGRSLQECKDQFDNYCKERNWDPHTYSYENHYDKNKAAVSQQAYVPAPAPDHVPSPVVQPDPDLAYVELIGSAFTEGGNGERVTDLRFKGTSLQECKDQFYAYCRERNWDPHTYSYENHYDKDNTEVQPISSQTDSVACPVCGNILRTADRFCSRCGAPNSMSTCSGCGSALRPGDRFCSKCGKPV